MTEHFKPEEMRCKHCGESMIDGHLYIALEQLRALGPEPIIVHDAYRCEAHNAAVGGVPGSEHTQGKAADITIQGLTLQQMYDRAERIPAFNYGGIGVYEEGFIHVDVRIGRHRWARVKSEYTTASALVDIGGHDDNVQA